MFKNNYKLNIFIAYAFNACRYSWFWLGVWVLYYSSFGGYSAVGILETVMVVTSILGEIPAGVIGDMLGKKRTLILGIVMNGFANIWMGFAPNLLHMALSLFFMNVGGAFMSGTFEAFIYDTLKESKQEEKYKRVLANVSTSTLITMMVVAPIGAYLYGLMHGLPFILNGIFLLIGGILMYFAYEPNIDTQKYKLKDFVVNNLKGFKYLFSNIKVSIDTAFLWLVSFVGVILAEGFNDILLVEYGFDQQQLGFLAAICTLVAAISIQVLVRYTEKFNDRKVLIISGLLYAVSLVFAFTASIYLGAIFVMIRYLTQPLIDNNVSDIINRQTPSNARATTLSTFSMIKMVPYALIVYVFTSSIETLPAQGLAVVLGLIMGAGILVYWLIPKNKAAVS